MSEMTPESHTERSHLEERAEKLAREKAHLNMLIHMMGQLSAVTGLDDAVANLLQVLVNNIGGVNLALYYWIDDEITCVDVFGKKEKLDAIEDTRVVQVIENRAFLGYEHDFSDTHMMTPAFTRAHTWVIPLTVGPDLIGVLKIEGLHIGTDDLTRELPTFFSYVALFLKNEILGHTRLQKAYSQLSETHAELTAAMSGREEAERQIKERMKELQAFFNLSELVTMHDLTLAELYRTYTDIMPESWQYPEIACARMVIGDSEFRTDNFMETAWMQSAPLRVHEAVVGKIEVGYLEERPERDEGPFLKEERLLIHAIAEWLGHIIEREQDEEKIRKLLSEKELLLREVHHRIKNNMATMVSMLSLQANSLDDPLCASSLKEAKSRLQSMMVLYDKLYRSADFRAVSTEAYLPPLIDEIVGNFPNRGAVTIEKEIEDHNLDAKTLSPIGIILNELLTNAMKHAFTGRDKGLLRVSFSLREHHALLSVQDNGIGIPESVDIKTATGFGMQLVDILTEQLQGTIRIERREGTEFILEFDV